MEVASYLSNTAASVAVVGPSRYPYERSLGPQIGRMIMQVRSRDGVTVNAECDCSKRNNNFKQQFPCFKMLEEKNVKFYMTDFVDEIKGENGKVDLLLLHQH